MANPQLDSSQGFYEDFHRRARPHPGVISPSNFTYRLILDVVSRYLREGMYVLEIGCGLGAISLYAASRGNRVLGTDISERAIAACRSSAQALGLNDRARFEAVDFLQSDFGTQVDIIICSEVLEHLADDRQALMKVRDLLRPGGIIILSVPSRNAPIHRLRMYLLGRDSFDIQVGHLRRYTWESITRLAKETGFIIVEAIKAEGVLRNLLFVTGVGAKLVRFIRPPITPLVTAVDKALIPLWGESQIFVVARTDERSLPAD